MPVRVGQIRGDLGACSYFFGRWLSIDRLVPSAAPRAPACSSLAQRAPVVPRSPNGHPLSSPSQTQGKPSIHHLRTVVLRYLPKGTQGKPSGSPSPCFSHFVTHPAQRFGQTFGSPSTHCRAPSMRCTLTAPVRLCLPVICVLRNVR